MLKWESEKEEKQLNNIALEISESDEFKVME